METFTHFSLKQGGSEGERERERQKEREGERGENRARREGEILSMGKIVK
jgi:hypothetical protein